jgi:hypothetical protein
MVDFVIVSLIDRVPISETMDLLDVLILTTSNIIFNGQFYGQTDAVAMGSPFSHVISNVCMEDYEKAALESASLKPRCRVRYVDDTFVIWPHGPDKRKDFPHYLHPFNSPWKMTAKATPPSWT